MRFLKLLLWASLMFTTVTNYCVRNHTENDYTDISKVDYYSLGNVESLHYNIKLIPHMEQSKFTFSGECYIRIKILNATQVISLHSLELEINETETFLISDDEIIYKPNGHYLTKRAIIDLNFDSQLSPGFYTLYVSYFGIPSQKERDGFYRMLYVNEEGYRVWIATKPFVTVAVRRYPQCYDDPIFKPTYNISVRHHRKYKALSNMPIREQYADTDGMVWSHFYITPHMISCTIIVIVLNFVRVSNADETVNVWCRSNITSQVRFAQYIAENFALRMVEYTNISNIIPKTDHVLMPKFTLTGISNWGLITYKEENINEDLAYQRNIANTVAHEMIHQWFGNLVSPSWWFDSWLNEGFASLLQADILNKMFTHWRAIDFLVIESLHGSLHTDTSYIMDSLMSGMNNPSTIDDSSAFYDKAPVILRMLQHLISEEVFRKGVNIFLHTHQFHSASTDDLWTAMQTALNGSSISHRDFKIKEVMEPWITQIHYPLVTVTRNYETGEVIISQEHYYVEEDDENNVIENAKWWIPITYTTQTNPDFKNTMLNFRWLSPNGNISFVINSNDWIILNLQQTGYYRVNYDITNWRKIADYLNSNKYRKIHILNRAQLIDDAFNLVIERQLDSSIFFNLSNYLSRETDYIAWYPMFNALTKISKVFFLPGSESLKSQLARNFDKLLEDVGSEDKPNDDDIITLKRLTVLQMACFFDNPLCQRMATAKLNKHLVNHEKLSPFLYQWTYCSGLMAANMTTWIKVMNLYTEKPQRYLLRYLACSRDPHIIINYLNMISSKSSMIEKEEHNYAFNYIINKRMRNNLVLNYVLENLERLKPKLMTTDDVLKHITYSIVSKEQFETVQTFVKNNITEKEIIERYCCTAYKINLDSYTKWFIDNKNQI